MTDRRERVRALFLCTLVVLSVLSGPIAFSGPVAAATNASFSVANDAPGATTTLTAELDRESTGDSVGKLELNLSGSGASFSDQSSDYTVEVINPDGTTQDSLKDGNDISLSTSNGRETATLSFSQPDGGVDVGDTIRIEASGFTNPGSSGTYTGNYVINPDSTPKSVSASIDIGDTTKPTVTSITRSSPTSRIIQNGPVDFKVQFSEPVSNVGTDDFDLNESVGVFGSVDSVNSSGGSTITVEVIEVFAAQDSSGSLGLDIQSSNDIEDSAGNPLDTTEPATDETFLVDNNAPSLDTNSGATVDEGSDTTVANSALAASDAEQSAGSLEYTVTDTVDHGTLKVAGNAVGNDGTFTQADVSNGDLLYSHDGSETTSDRFDFRISDTNASPVTGKTFSITVDPVNDAPTLTVITLNSKPSFTEGGNTVEPFDDATVGVVESSQQVRNVRLEVKNLTDGSAEKVVVDGSSLALTDGSSVTDTPIGLDADVTGLSSGTATVNITGNDGSGFSTSTANTVLKHPF